MNKFIERWEGPLFAFAWRYVQNSADAHDLVAEAFVRLHQKRQKLRPDTKVGAWLFTTLSNLCHNQNRWRKRHPTVSLDATDDETGQSLSDRTPAEATLPSDDMEKSEAVKALRQAIDQLPHELKNDAAPSPLRAASLSGDRPDHRLLRTRSGDTPVPCKTKTAR